MCITVTASADCTANDRSFEDINYRRTTTLYMQKNKTYTFNLEKSVYRHPWGFSTTLDGTDGTALTTGVVHVSHPSPNSTGQFKFTPPVTYPETIYFQCTNHPGMGGMIRLRHPEGYVYETDASTTEAPIDVSDKAPTPGPSSSPSPSPSR